MKKLLLVFVTLFMTIGTFANPQMSEVAYCHGEYKFYTNCVSQGGGCVPSNCAITNPK